MYCSQSYSLAGILVLTQSPNPHEKRMPVSANDNTVALMQKSAQTLVILDDNREVGREGVMITIVDSETLRGVKIGIESNDDEQKRQDHQYYADSHDG